MAYQPKTPMTRWLREQIVAALREHGELNTSELCEAVGWRAMPLTPGNAWCDKCRTAHRPNHPIPLQRDPHDGLRFVQLSSPALQPTMTGMERNGELVRRRFHSSDIWRWSLGDEAPESIDVTELEALIG